MTSKNNVMNETSYPDKFGFKPNKGISLQDYMKETTAKLEKLWAEETKNNFNNEDLLTQNINYFPSQEFGFLIDKNSEYNDKGLYHQIISD
ncbi:hypothetical protein ABN224_20015 [Providencia rettgeri]|uniref:hypothetical protein n=1 Tax=Providencia rettgeri TaxID=587 RepID=UPI0013742167|nr:hypothetical protein [Providencia rettgeri]MCG9528369.1 hypothetical protein [Providencia rettgeri]BBV06257.1 hypothetical protein BML2531_40330 [Providencia rettgeri]